MKFKKIPNEYFVTILDRLTRFEPAYIRYNRVFDDIINKFCIDIKTKNLSVNDKIQICEEIFNKSIEQNNDYFINSLLKEHEEKYFYHNEESYQYLSARINISSMASLIDKKQYLPQNVRWLIEICIKKKNPEQLRSEKSLFYPIEKLILCEGQTEYTLLETIFRLFNIDFNKLGYMPIAAGGKNQVARKYYNMIEYTKLPFFILLDKDALSIKELIEPKLRSKDKLYLINDGEFEDLIPKNILKNTINAAHSSDLNCKYDDFSDNDAMVYNLENIYKKYGFGEFKKAKFAVILKEYIANNCTKHDFMDSEIVNIIERFNE